MDAADLRIALFSGNYNMTVDGANKALNRLVGYLLRNGAQVRVYSPTIDDPPFEPTGDLISLPSIAIPGRAEYRLPLRLSGRVRADLRQFAPNIMHVSSPDFAARAAARWASRRGLPVLASVHTRFETYPRYYHLGFTEGLVESWLRRLYRRCDALVTPSQSMADVLRQQGMNEDISLWERGVDRSIFDPGRRDPALRRELGLAEDDVAVGFLGRLVQEKGLDTFVATMARLRETGVAHRVLVVGDGPARPWLEARLPDAIFTGFRQGPVLGRAVASMDVLLNPSVTETFGNVTLEAMASGVPVVAARAAGSSNLVADKCSGRLVAPGDIEGFAKAVGTYATDRAMRLAHGAAGEQRSRAYGWDAINGALVSVYRRLLANSRSEA